MVRLEMMVPGELLESDQLSDVCCFLLASLEMLGHLSQQENGELRRAGSQWMETRVGLFIRPVIRNVNNQIERNIRFRLL